jgi:hypothetical protein
MRIYQNVNGLIVQTDKDLKWDGWREVSSAGPASGFADSRPEEKTEVAPVQQTDEIEEPQDNSPADDDDSDLEVPEEPKRGKRK